MTDSMSFDEAIRTIKSQQGDTLLELSAEAPLLVVFLRHAGCTFCREALADISEQRSQIENSGTKIALVHMSSEEKAAEFLKSYQLDELPRFSDPLQRLYQAFDLHLGSFRQLFGWRVLRRGLVAALLKGHGFGPLQGNGLRMPGVFLLKNGNILKAFRHQTAADRPDYLEISCQNS